MTAPAVVGRSFGHVNSAAVHPVGLNNAPLFSPTNMTSDTAPSPYVVTQSSAYSTSYDGHSAFDNNVNDHWTATATTGYVTLDIGSGNSQILYQYSVTSCNDGTANSRSPKTWTIQGSNDFSTWTVIDTQTSQTAWGNAETRTFTVATQSTAYRYWKLNVTANNGDSTYMQVGELMLYSPPATITVGNLFVVVFSSSGTAANFTGVDLTASGTNWWEVGSQINTAANQPYQTVWAKVAQGSDALQFKTLTGVYTSYVVYQISGHGSAVTYATLGSGNSTNADPPSCTQSGSAQDTLAIAAYTGYNQVASLAPSGYGNLVTASNGNTGFTSTADKSLTAINTENPGAFTSPNDYWIGTTLLVPAGAITTKARITQDATEVLSQSNPNARITQVATETLSQSNPNARITQVATEVLSLGSPNARITQVAIEVLSNNVIMTFPNLGYDVFDNDSVSTAGISFNTDTQLTATATAGSTDNYVIAQTFEGKKSGKWYVEHTCNAISGGNDSCGIMNSLGLGTYYVGHNSTSWGFYNDGIVYNNAAGVTIVNGSAYTAGQTVGQAIDLDHGKMWFTLNGGSTWIGASGTPNPATNTGGIDISAALANNCRVYPCVGLHSSGAKWTANFGQNTFSGTVPTGFTSGWTNTTAGSYFGTFATTGNGGMVNGSQSSNYVLATPYTATFTGTISSLIIPFTSAAGATQGFVYADSSGAPGALLATSSNTPSGAGELTFTFSTPLSVTSGTQYWFGWNSTSGNPTINAPPLTSGYYYKSQTYGVSLNPYGTGTTNNYRFPFLINKTAVVVTTRRYNVQTCS